MDKNVSHLESDDGTNRHPEFFGIVNATYKKYTEGGQSEGMHCFAEDGKCMLMAIGNVLLEYFEAAGALDDGWLQTAIQSLEEMESSRPTAGEGYSSLTIDLHGGDEYVFPALDDCPENWQLALRDYARLHKKCDLVPKTRERHMVEAAKACVPVHSSAPLLVLTHCLACQPVRTCRDLPLQLPDAATWLGDRDAHLLVH